jgi:hypothetical protein
VTGFGLGDDPGHRPTTPRRIYPEEAGAGERSLPRAGSRVDPSAATTAERLVETGSLASGRPSGAWASRKRITGPMAPTI